LPPDEIDRPTVQLLYFHYYILKKLKLRKQGFIELQDLTGDIDFFGYPGEDCAILIDSLGKVFDMRFYDVVYPNSIIATWSEGDIKENIMPSLKYAQNELFLNEVLNERM
jgi:hypothetical protein